MKKLFTLALAMLASVGLWAATETINTSGSNTAYDGTCATIDGAYIAGGTSSGYSKFRTNVGDTLKITIKDGWKVTGFSIQAYSNNSGASASISMTSLIYDGGENLLTSDVVFSPSGTKPSAPNYTNTTNEASSKIVMSFDNSNFTSDKDSKNRQIMAIIILTYEMDCTAADATFEAASNNIEIALNETSVSTNLTFTPGDNTSNVTYVVTKGGEATDKASVTAGVFTATAAGVYKVTATQAYDGTYCEVSKEVVITVTDVNGPSCSGVLFKMEALKVCTCSIASKVDYPLTDGEDYSIEGGSLLLYNVNNSQKVLMTKNQSSLVQWNWNTGDISFNVTMDCDLMAGDTIKYTTNQTKQDVYINTTKANKPAAGQCDTIKSANGYYVVKSGSNLEGRNSFSLWRSGTSTYIRTFEVVRPAPSHTLTWDFAGGNCSATAGTDYTAPGLIEEGKPIAYPAANSMTKDNYDFAGWSTDVTAMPTSDLTITAQWTAHVASSDATLADLTVNGTTVDGFAAATEEYDIELPFGTTEIPAVAATANSPYAKSVVITQATAVDGSATVVVTAEDNSTKTYTINFSVAESMVLDLVWKTGQNACAVAGSQTTAIKSDDAKVNSYIKKITFENAEGSGDDAAEGSSLNTGKKAGNTIIIQTQSGYLFKAMSFFGKIESADAKCFISIDGGNNWSDLESTGGNDATYCDVISDASTNDIRIKSNGAAGVWIRNMQLTVMASSTTPTALDNADAAVKAVKRIENGQLFIEKNGVIYNAQGARLQ